MHWESVTIRIKQLLNKSFKTVNKILVNAIFRFWLFRIQKKGERNACLNHLCCFSHKPVLLRKTFLALGWTQVFVLFCSSTFMSTTGLHSNSISILLSALQSLCIWQQAHASWMRPSTASLLTKLLQTSEGSSTLQLKWTEVTPSCFVFKGELKHKQLPITANVPYPHIALRRGGAELPAYSSKFRLYLSAVTQVSNSLNSTRTIGSKSY